MTSTRALTWMCLFPRDASYMCNDGPKWLRDSVRKQAAEDLHRVPAGQDARRRRVLITANRTLGEVITADELFGLVQVNGRETSERELKEAGFAYVRRFAVLPGWDNPRLFVPLDTPRVASAAFDLMKPVRWPARVAHGIAKTAARSGLRHWYRDTVLVAQRECPPLERLLEKLFSDDGGNGVRPSSVCVAMSSGNLETVRNRKLSFAILDDLGRTLGFGKWSLSPLSRRRMQHEAEIELALDPMPGVVGAPRLLFEGDVDGNYVTVSSPLAGATPGRRLTQAHRHFLATLEQETCQPAAHCRLVLSLRQRAAQVSAGPALLQTLDRVSAVLEQLVLPVTVVHRDFAPWNLCSLNGKIAAFDWEYAELEGLPLLDEIHHQMADAYFVRKWQPQQACDQLLRWAAAAPRGLNFEQVVALLVVYLVDHLVVLGEEGYPADYPKVVWWQQVLRRLEMCIPSTRGNTTVAERGRSIAPLQTASGPVQAESPHQDVRCVLEQFMPGETSKEITIRRRNGGGQGGIFTVGKLDGRPIWSEHRELIVKVFDPSKKEVAEAVSDEFATLRRFRSAVEGSTINGWHIRCPLPLFQCNHPYALVMTPVPGEPLSWHLENTQDPSGRLLDGIAAAVMHALEEYWLQHGCAYGDLNFRNILCDLPSQTLSFVDCGMPTKAWKCERASYDWHPVSRDLAYMLYSVAVSVREFLGRASVSRRHQRMIEKMLRVYLAGIESSHERLSLLEEVRVCAAIHVSFIQLSYSPAGLWRTFVRRTARSTIDRILRSVESEMALQAERIAVRQERAIL